MRIYHRFSTVIFLVALFLTGCGIYGDDRLGELATDPSLVAYYPFNGSAEDESGNEHDGIMYNVTSTYDRFYISNRALLFYDSLSYVEIPPENGFNLSGTPFTISAWINCTGWSALANYVFCMESTTIPFIELYFFSGYCFFGINGNYTNSGSLITESMWSHVSAVWDGSTQSIYINGILDSQNTVGPISNPVSGKFRAVIGSNFDPTTYSFTGSFNGTIDDFVIFNRALSPEEISKLYNNSK